MEFVSISTYMYYQGPVLQRVDINRNLFAININRNYVHER